MLQDKIEKKIHKITNENSMLNDVIFLKKISKKKIGLTCLSGLACYDFFLKKWVYGPANPSFFI